VEYIVYPDKLEYVKSTILGDFYSRLPFCHISINKAEDDLFLGAVRLTNYFPNTSYGGDSAIVYTDNEDRLQGFNARFFEYFREGFKRPGDLLGKPAGRFLSPSPNDIQKDYLAALKKPAARAFGEPVVQGLALDGKKALLNPADFVSRGQKTEWVSKKPAEYSFITFARELEYLSEDFLLEATVERIAGDVPIFILGDPQRGTQFPDLFDYATGSWLDPLQFILRKRGFTVAGPAQTKKPLPRLVRYRFFKVGFAIFLEVNGETVISHYDFDFLESPRSCVSIGLKPGSRTVLQDVRLNVRRLDRPLGKKKVMVRLQTPKQAFFTLNSIYNDGLSTGLPHIRSFALFDVTEFQENVDRFQTLYRDQKRERDRLSTILSRFQAKEGVFLGDSRLINQIKEKAAVIAGANATVLIQGEFVKVDCSTLAPTPIESELFGHEKGAFTGAVDRKRGKFEQANRGTLFLDEINNLNLETQAKILNFLQDFVITRVGGEKPIKLDLRIIIASNISIEEMVRRGEFRADLFFRINMVSIELPPLRRRMDDVPMLCEYFLQLFSLQYGKAVRGITTAAYKKLYAHLWPGNVRELKNVLNKAFIFCEGPEIDEGLIDLPRAGLGAGMTSMPAQAKPEPAPVTRRKGEAALTSEKMREIMKRNRGNVYQAARELGMTRQTVYYYLRKFNIKVEKLRE
jgi:DNA-binding NtrC family response regulator